MAIYLTCLKCGQSLKVGDEYGGKMGMCPKCKTSMRIPLKKEEEPAEIEWGVEETPSEGAEGTEPEEPVFYPEDVEMVVKEGESESEIPKKKEVSMEREKVVALSDYVERVAGEFKLPVARTKRMLDFLIGEIVKDLSNGRKVEIRRFGTFGVRSKRARIGRNPKTGEKIEVPAKKSPYFKPSGKLKEKVNA